eukprot:7651173-Lingulodinium_polyedra.AAC.1
MDPHGAPVLPVPAPAAAGRVPVPRGRGAAVSVEVRDAVEAAEPDGEGTATDACVADLRRRAQLNDPVCGLGKRA